MKCARSGSSVPKRALRFFHLRAHRVQVVRGRDDREEKNESATERAEQDERLFRFARLRIGIRTAEHRGGGRRSPLPPQQKGWQQQRKPTKIEEKLHTKHPGRTVVRTKVRTTLRTTNQTLKAHISDPVQLPQDIKNSIRPSSDLGTRRRGRRRARPFMDRPPPAKPEASATVGAGSFSSLEPRRWHQRESRTPRAAGCCQTEFGR